MKDLQIFERLLVRPLADVHESQYGYWLRIAHENGLERAQWLLSDHERWASGIARFCSGCLAADHPCWRVEWLDPRVHWCSRHSAWLIDTCSGCNRQMRWSRTSLLECRCGHDLRSCEAHPVGSRLLDCVSSGEISVADLRVLGALALYGSAGKPGKKAKRALVHDVRLQIETGLEIVDAWPESFFDVMDRYRAAVNSAGSVQLFNDAFVRLKELPNLLSSGTWQRRVVMAMDEYCRRSLVTASPVVGRNEVLTTRPKTIKQIASQLGCRSESVVKLLDAQSDGLHRWRRSSGGRTRRVVAEGDISKLRVLLTQSLQIKSAARLLALPVSRLIALLQAGTLNLVDGRVRRGDLQAWVQGIYTQSGSPHLDLQALRHVLRRWVAVDETADFFHALERGELMAWVARDQLHLGSALVEEAAVKAWVTRLRHQPRVQMMLSEVAAVLRVKHEVVRDLIRCGLLKASMGTISRRHCWRITNDDLASFQSSYVALIELTKRANVRSKDGVAWAQEQGLHVATGPCIDGSRQYFVKRPVEALFA